jgi:preprotein translocase subunit SecY
MVVNRDKAPSAQETFLQMAQAAGLRGRILITVGLLVLLRLGVFIPVPGINRSEFAASVSQSGVLSFLDVFAGGGLKALGIFALGIIPYINASIILQLLTAAIPALEDLQKNEGEAGRRKISQYTRYVALAWAIIQSTMLTVGLLQGTGPNGIPLAENFGPWFIVQTVLTLTAGSMFVMWVGELITERGIGNGASLLIFLNIVSSLPNSFGRLATVLQSTDNREAVTGAVILLLVFVAMVVGIVFVQEGTRRIPIIVARRQVGRQMFLERSSYLPLRLNQGGVMPIIFASAVLSLPLFLERPINQGWFSNIVRTYLAPGGSQAWVYTLVYLVLILFFSYFYSSLVIQPDELSKNLKKMGASIPGIRPGKATTEYVEGVLNRLTLLGAIFLGVVAIVPTAIEGSVPGGRELFSGFGATSLLILVGVAIDTAKQIQTYVISQRYEGMVKQ